MPDKETVPYDIDMQSHVFKNVGGIGIGDTTARVVRTATVVVAAADSSEESKSQADFVCTGSDDNVIIQQAIDSLPSGGGKVVLMEGTFLLSSCLSLVNDLIIEGCGIGNTTLKIKDSLGANSPIFYAATSDVLSNITIRRLTLNPNSTGNPGYSMDAIYLGTTTTPVGNKTNIIIENIQITDARIGISISGGRGVWIKDCDINVLSQGVNLIDTYDGYVLNNKITGSGSAPGQGIWLYQYERFVVANNVMTGLGYGLRVSNVTFLRVEGNDIYGVTTNSNIDINTVKSADIVGNILHDNPSYDGICFDGVSRINFSNNIVYNTKRGIVVGGTKNIISSNILRNNDNGIKAYNVTSTTIIGNEIVDNTGDGISFYNDSGASGIEDILITNNQILDNGGKGIYLQTSWVANSIVDTVIRGNTILNNTGGAIINEGTNTNIQHNQGYTTENSGTATITAGNTSIDVTHGLAGTPTRVYLTPTTDTAGRRYWVSAKGSSTFTITIDSSHTADISFDWKAEM